MKTNQGEGLKNWKVVSPESVGIPSRAVLNFIEELEHENLCMHGFAMVKDGMVFAEGYYAPFHADFPHRMFSVSKSFTSLAIGLLQQEGKLSINDSICDYFPDLLPADGVHPYIGQTTVRDMLRMATPHKSTTYKQVNWDDWVKSFFHVEPVRFPGTSFLYDTSASHVLSALVERLSGLSLLDYLRMKVFDELHCSNHFRWLTCPKGICQGGSGLICTLRDLVKVAYSCMNHGRFGGKQIIPAEYIQQATAKQIDTSLQPSIEEQQGYGYQFWRCRNNGFAMYGMGGQLAVCLPEHDFMLVTTADTQGNPYGIQGIYEALWHQILPYLKGRSQGTISVEPLIVDKLKDKIAHLKVQVETGAMQSNTASSIHSRKYCLSQNPMGITECRVKFLDGSGVLNYRNENGDHEIAFGLGRMIQQKFPEINLTCISSAAWVEENKLHLRSYIIEELPGSVNMTITFKQNTITLVMKKIAENQLEQYEGFASGVWEEET